MTKLILLGVAVVVIVWVLRRAFAAPRADTPPPAAGGKEGELVSCAHCGVNLPKGEALVAGSRVFCSEEHRRLGPKDG
ncbi:MAG: PP0621 family protein [Alphaproteobacteria bacterium]